MVPGITIDVFIHQDLLMTSLHFGTWKLDKGTNTRALLSDVIILSWSGSWTLLVIVKDQSSHLAYLNIMHKITNL